MPTPTVTVKLRKVAGSVVVSIPRRLLEECGLAVGDMVELTPVMFDSGEEMAIYIKRPKNETT